MSEVNAVFWLLSNLTVVYIAVALIAFVFAYPILFDPGATTAGKLVLRFALSLVGVIGLVFVSLFINPRQGGAWFEYPGDVFWWRPAVRFLVYVYVAYSITSLDVLLWLRKYRPHLVQTAPDENTLPVKVRRPRKHKE